MDLLLFFNFTNKYMFDIIVNKNICSEVVILIKEDERLNFHIGVNSAYFSWTAVKLLQYGNELDIPFMLYTLRNKTVKLRNRQ